jgi:hypothetical protein
MVYMRWAVLTAAAMISLTSHAQAPTDAPTGTTGLCNDGSYYSGPPTKSPCALHGGIKQWYVPAEPKPASAAAAPAATSATAPATTSGETGVPTHARRRKSLQGLAQVRVDTTAKVYYCLGTAGYASSENGELMSEADAKAAGNRAYKGKGCS